MSQTSPCPCLRIETSGKGKQLSTRVILDISVSPNAPRTEVTGWHDGALRLRLSAPPVDGAANDALVEFLAAHFDCAKRHVRIVSGEKSRSKRVAIAGISAATVRQRLSD